MVAAEWPESACSLLSRWPRSGPIQHSHFYRGGRGVAPFSILTSIVVAAEWPDSAFSLLSWCPPGTEPCKNPRLLGRRRYMLPMMMMMMMMMTAAIMCFSAVGQCVCVCVSVDSRHLLNRMNTKYYILTSTSVCETVATCFKHATRQIKKGGTDTIMRCLIVFGNGKRRL